jgi:hypothetical protein
VKTNLSLDLINYATRHEDVWGAEVIAISLLTSAIGEGEWSTSCLCPFTPGETASETHCIEGRVGPRACVDGAEKKEKKKILPCRKLYPDSSVVKAVAQSLHQLSYPASTRKQA